MKRLLFLSVIGLFCCCAKPDKEPDLSGFKEGDILFQSSSSSQAQAIQLATHSKYSHVGIVLKHKGQLMVFEAVQPIKYTPLKDWASHPYVQRRLKDDKVLTLAVLDKMHTLADSYNGRNYDVPFNWDDKEFYCSELVWKLYQRSTGLEVGQTKKFKDYDFSHPVVKQEVEARYGGKLPLEEPMISPGAIHDSELLMTVSSK